MIGPWRRRIAVVATALVVIQAAMVVTDMGPQLLVVTGVGLFVAAATWLVVDLDAVAVRRPPREPPPPPPGGTANLRITALRQALASVRRDHHTARQLHSRLLELVDDALATRGIDRRTDPSTAAVAMGPELTRYLAGDPVRSLAELGRIVTLIEEL